MRFSPAINQNIFKPAINENIFKSAVKAKDPSERIGEILEYIRERRRRIASKEAKSGDLLGTGLEEEFDDSETVKM